MRSIWRAVVAFAYVLYGVVELVVTRPRTRPQRAAWLTGFCSRMLRVMDFHFTVEGPIPQSGAVITNHLTWIDILLHSAMRPCVFVSKAEVRAIPVIGWMSMMAGTVYVARGQGGSADKAAEVMAKGFRDGLPVVFFPEGTTGTGEETVMPFRSGLLAQTLEAGAPVSPGFITYSLAEVDRAAGRTLRKDVHWGPQSLLSLIWSFLHLHGLHATVRFAELPIAFSQEALADRKVAAEEARLAVLRLADAPTSWPQPTV